MCARARVRFSVTHLADHTTCHVHPCPTLATHLLSQELSTLFGFDWKLSGGESNDRIIRNELKSGHGPDVGSLPWMDVSPIFMVVGVTAVVVGTCSVLLALSSAIRVGVIVGLVCVVYSNLGFAVDVFGVLLAVMLVCITTAAGVWATSDLPWQLPVTWPTRHARQRMWSIGSGLLLGIVWMQANQHGGMAFATVTSLVSFLWLLIDSEVGDGVVLFGPSCSLRYIILTSASLGYTILTCDHCGLTVSSFLSFFIVRTLFAVGRADGCPLLVGN